MAVGICATHLAIFISRAWVRHMNITSWVEISKTVRRTQAFSNNNTVTNNSTKQFILKEALVFFPTNVSKHSHMLYSLSAYAFKWIWLSSMWTKRKCIEFMLSIFIRKKTEFNMRIFSNYFEVLMTSFIQRFQSTDSRILRKSTC